MSVEGALAAKPEVEIWWRPDFWTLTPTSYSTPNTLLGLSRTVTELPPGAVTINAIVKASDNAKIFQVENAFFQL